jgi:hypothetical protein
LRTALGQLGTTQLESLASGVASLKQPLIAALPTTLPQALVSKLAGDQFNYLTDDQYTSSGSSLVVTNIGSGLANLLPARLAKFTQSQITGLTGSQLTSMSDGQVSALTSAQLGWLASTTDSSGKTLMSYISSRLSSDQTAARIASMSATEIGLIDPNSISTYVGKLTPAQAHGLVSAQIQKLDAAQLKALLFPTPTTPPNSGGN